jgi:hypothetical protein
MTTPRSPVLTMEQLVYGLLKLSRRRSATLHRKISALVHEKTGSGVARSRVMRALRVLRREGHIALERGYWRHARPTTSSAPKRETRNQRKAERRAG